MHLQPISSVRAHAPAVIRRERNRYLVDSGTPGRGRARQWVHPDETIALGAWNQYGPQPDPTEREARGRLHLSRCGRDVLFKQRVASERPRALVPLHITEWSRYGGLHPVDEQDRTGVHGNRRWVAAPGNGLCFIDRLVSFINRFLLNYALLTAKNQTSQNEPCPYS